ncbi:aldo/keto reductase [Leuconostoc mesenteroides]|uniref:aldo/keto reductase n=1 Tax=Leuconostoc mesenteroides TaxID=1245 RepID=UPI001CBAD91D|nr:aldo/keto reductase [Leuconostoc mesenteroides]MBZ1508268.1 aldo/keto reductase [Leuconostoc mesenteroides]MBZ1533918.1 aldo/keto reductase [Leuconostoc mesenteroides]UVV92012.1 aldo/keto reductase [Leuconostoc mesenteroides]
MEKIKLGVSDLNASRVGLGVMRMGTRSESEAQKTVESALSRGINFFESSNIYGNGKSSASFGKALKSIQISRESILIQSKAGIIRGDNFKRVDFSKDNLIKSVEDELQRLGTDYLDSFVLHRPDVLVEPEEVAEAFNSLEKSGKVRYFGVSNQNSLDIELLKTAVKQPLIVNQLQFSIMHTGMIDQQVHVNSVDNEGIMRDAELLAYSRLNNMTIQTWSPLQFGYFGGVFIDNDKFPILNEKLRQLANKYSTSKSAIAIAWILRHPARMQVIIGSMSDSHIREMTDGDKFLLTRQEWYDIYFAAGNTMP